MLDEGEAAVPRQERRGRLDGPVGPVGNERPERNDRAGRVSLRQGGRNDELFLRDMALRVFAEFGDYRQSMREWLREASVITRVAQGEDGPVGFFMLEIYPWSWPGPRSLVSGRKGSMMAYLLAVGVLPDQQGQGIGRLLMQDAIACARAARPAASEVRLSVAEANTRARRLFAGLGFADCGLDQRLYENGQQALAMRLLLE